MADYIINMNPDTGGNHEVHKKSCSHAPDETHQKALGSFEECKPAVAKAKEITNFTKIDGCFYCCNECHYR